MDKIHQKIKLIKMEKLCLRRCFIEAKGDIKSFVSRNKLPGPIKLGTQFTLDDLFGHEAIMNLKSKLLQKHVKGLKYIVDEIIGDMRILWTHIERVKRMGEGQVQISFTLWPLRVTPCLTKLLDLILLIFL